ncbi:MAG: plastocyanin/azurin family copper-binding protein [Actinomycetia bacterium]|nr:plastocyanin/azurin family copper-binding protein [Actinomycetes bacterium]
MTKRISLSIVSIGVALAISACTTAPDTSSGSSPDQPTGDTPTTSEVMASTTAPPIASAENGTEVSIENFAFGPDEIVISVGDTLTWTNDEAGVGHTTTSDDGVWNSVLLNPGDTFEQTFDEAGTFTYFCSIHPSMTASITVNG